MSEFKADLVRLLPRLRRFARSLCGAANDAEDLVQSAVERALRNQDKWREGTRLDSWMFRIIQNLWLDELGMHRRKNASLDLALDMPGDDGREIVERRAELNAVRNAMLALPAEQRVVLALVVIDGMSYQDAAKTLGVPIGTVMSRVSRGRVQLSEALGARPSLKAARHD